MILCVYKSKGLPQYENQDARDAALSAAKIASDAAKKLEDDIEVARAKRELEAQQRAEMLAKEQQLVMRLFIDNGAV